MQFYKESYTKLLRVFKPHLINLYTPGNGIILRHDIDEDIDRAVHMAKVEHLEGVKSVYYILNTSKYWKNDHDLFVKLRLIQSLGHEIGWHNNAISDSINRGVPVLSCIETPLRQLRANGLIVTSSSSHGDALCHKHKFLNYNVFGFKAVGWDGYEGKAYNMKDFGLTIEAYHNGHTHYMTDSHGQWSNLNDIRLADFLENGGRLQILIHSQWWDLTR